MCAIYYDLAKAADEGHATHAIVLDFKKAFDKVPHLLLLQKLQGIPGINTYLLNWILDFFSDRQQSVVLRGVSSQGCRVTLGVPQRFVLGPTIFLCYINDLPDRAKLAFMLMTLYFIKLLTTLRMQKCFRVTSMPSLSGP